MTLLQIQNDFLHFDPAGQPIEIEQIADEHLPSKGITFSKVKAFVSTEQTGTGSSQSIAHGLAAVPVAVLVVPTDTSPATVGEFTVTEGTHTTTNIVLTVTLSKKYKVMAWV